MSSHNPNQAGRSKPSTFWEIDEYPDVGQLVRVARLYKQPGFAEARDYPWSRYEGAIGIVTRQTKRDESHEGDSWYVKQGEKEVPYNIDEIAPFDERTPSPERAQIATRLGRLALHLFNGVAGKLGRDRTQEITSTQMMPPLGNEHSSSEFPPYIPSWEDPAWINAGMPIYWPKEFRHRKGLK